MRSSIAPLPMNVVATGTWRPFANARSWSAARRRRTPLPASTIGREEPAISEAAWAMASSVGSGKYVREGVSGTRHGSTRGGGDVLGQLDVCRPRLLEPGGAERPGDRLGDRVGPLRRASSTS